MLADHGLTYTRGKYDISRSKIYINDLQNANDIRANEKIQNGSNDG